MATTRNKEAGTRHSPGTSVNSAALCFARCRIPSSKNELNPATAVLLHMSRPRIAVRALYDIVSAMNSLVGAGTIRFKKIVYSSTSSGVSGCTDIYR